jgi:hypothetical protein
MIRNMSKAYERVKNLDWNPTFIREEDKYVEPTRFHMPKKAVDPFKTFVREYLYMEQEKDHRAMAILEGANRVQGGHRDARWIEGMKFAMGNLAAVEHAAGRHVGRAARVVAPMELRQGYMHQVLDELRHNQLEMNLLRHHMRTSEDPEGFGMALQGSGSNVGSGIIRSMTEDFCTADAIEGALALQIFTELASTNILFVGLSSGALQAGDTATASTMLSIQSDESRHMANGTATLMTLLSDDRNVPLLQDVFDKWAWRAHLGNDVGQMLFADYFVRDHKESAKELVHRFYLDEFFGAFYKKLEKYGIKEPKFLPDIINNIEWASHSAAVYLFGAWPLFFHRYDGIDEREMEFFEKKYPGWYSHFGKFWEAVSKMTEPDDGYLATKELGGLPAFCMVCQLPTIFPRPNASIAVTTEKDGRTMTFCSPGCQWIYERDPDHYTCVTFYDRYDGWDLADVAVDTGCVRMDGKTLMAQPSLNPKRMWTIDDLRARKYEIVSPNRKPGVKNGHQPTH